MQKNAKQFSKTALLLGSFVVKSPSVLPKTHRRWEAILPKCATSGAVSGKVAQHVFKTTQKNAEQFSKTALPLGSFVIKSPSTLLVPHKKRGAIFQKCATSGAVSGEVAQHVFKTTQKNAEQFSNTALPLGSFVIKSLPVLPKTHKKIGSHFPKMRYIWGRFW